jgi:hypothetical protein
MIAKSWHAAWKVGTVLRLPDKAIVQNFMADGDSVLLPQCDSGFAIPFACEGHGDRSKYRINPI